MEQSMSTAIRRAGPSALGAALLACASLTYGEDFQSTARDLAAQIEYAKETIAGWNSEAGLLIAIATIVGVLGASIALLQQLGPKRRWCSVSIAVVGFIISALTIFTNNYFDADHKTYRKQAHVAKRYITEAERYLGRLAQENDVNEKRALLVLIGDKIAGFQQLEDKLLLDTTHLAGSLPTAISIAYAQLPTRPAWTSQQRSQSATAYRFVGNGINRSLSTAQAESLQDARRTATQLLSIPPDSVIRYARAVDSYTEYDNAQQVYRHYTLLELNKALAQH
jgi:uncharacterized membrane protein YphA (DoxX/SURF4 family)